MGLGVYILVNEKDRSLIFLFGVFLLFAGLILGYFKRFYNFAFFDAIKLVSKDQNQFGYVLARASLNMIPVIIFLVSFIMVFFYIMENPACFISVK